MAENIKIDFGAGVDGIVCKTVILMPSVRNPLLVLDSRRRACGSATMSVIEGGFRFELHLDKNRPETFDLFNDPRLLAWHLELRGDQTELTAVLILDNV